MANVRVTCPQCGIELKLRLGTYECEQCGTTLDAAGLKASEPHRGLRRREPWQVAGGAPLRQGGGDPWAGTAESPREAPAPVGRYSAPPDGIVLPASGSGVLPSFLSPPDSIYAVARGELKLDKLHSEKAVFLLIQLLLCLGPTVIYTAVLAELDSVFPGLSNILISGMLINLVLSAALLYLDYQWVKLLGCGLMALGIAGSLVAAVVALGNPFMHGVAWCYVIGIVLQAWLFTICYRDLHRLRMQQAHS